MEKTSQRRPAARHRRLAFALAALALVGSLSACGSVRYVSQSAWGGLRLMAKREPISRLLDKDRLQDRERRSLEQILEMRDFATRELGLPDNKSYRSYVDVGRPWVTWSVTAAPADSVRPLVWCFPVAGCVSYRGYFSQRRAERFAEKLRQQGYDVATGPVTAFSTLGWFADPVLNTFLGRRPADVAGLVFHELSHQVVYVKDDTSFNESFATAVEILGQKRWLESVGRPDDFERVLEERAAQESFVKLVLEARGALDDVYSNAEAGEVAKLKEQAFERLSQRYEETHEDWDPDRRYAGWFARELNNAHLVQVGSYHQHVDFFLALFERQGGFSEFYEAVAEMARLSPEERNEALSSSD
ncbi:MAG: aminopeptidase [Acidobacteriota bacterium]